LQANRKDILIFKVASHDYFDIDDGMYDVNLKSMVQRELKFGQK
jgi:hypothetical protein